MKFRLGQLVATPGALDLLSEQGVVAYSLVQRHHTGDWGDLGREDKQANDYALKMGGRIVSAYSVGRVKIYVITEADRLYTTILKAEEY